MKGVGGLQGRKQEREIRSLSGARSYPLNPTTHAAWSPLLSVPKGSQTQRREGPKEVTQPLPSAHPLLSPGGEGTFSEQCPAFKPSSFPPFPSPEFATTNRSKWPRRPKGTSHPGESAGPLLESLSCLPLKVGRGVAGLGWGLRCLLLPICVSVLRLILGARQGSEVTRKAWTHH